MKIVQAMLIMGWAKIDQLIRKTRGILSETFSESEVVIPDCNKITVKPNVNKIMVIPNYKNCSKVCSNAYICGNVSVLDIIMNSDDFAISLLPHNEKRLCQDFVVLRKMRNRHHTRVKRVIH